MTQPADLNISGKQDPSNKDYFDITINPLKLVTQYGFQFQWIFEDKELNAKVGDNWSPTFKVTTIADAINKPEFRSIDLDYTTNTLLVSWSGKDYLGNPYNNNLSRIDIYAKGGSFGETYKVVGQFLKTGTQTITAVAGQYWVKLQAVSNSGGVSEFSAEQTIITESPIIVDNIPPANPSSPSVSSGVDPKDQTGFSAYATFSWTHHPNAATNGTRGYRVRWTYDTENPIYEYGFVDYPNNSYTATGLIPNIEYTFQVASVDQFNNTQTYLTGGTFTATDSTSGGAWARLKNYLSAGGATGDLFKFGTGIPASINTSLTTTPSLTNGTYNGIILNKTGNNNNYWLTTGQFRVGGNTQFMYWDGTNLSITGDLGVGGGATIAGNLFMKTSGASIYSGSLNVSGELPDGTAGYILNKDGLLVQNNETGSNRKYVRLDPATGTLFANNAQITGNIVITAGSTKDAIDAAANKSRIYRQTAQPTGTSYNTGDLWVDTDDNNKIYSWSGSAWVLTQDSAAAKAVADDAAAAAATAAARAQKFDVSGNINNGLVLNTTGSIYSTKSSYADTSTGWFLGWREVTPGNYTPAINIGGTTSYMRWNGTNLEIAGSITVTGGNAATTDSVTTLTNAVNAKNRTFVQASAPTASAIGDLWIDSDDKNKLYRWNGSAWADVRDTDISTAASNASTALDTANGKNKTFVQASAPTVGITTGDLWIDSDDKNKLYRYNGSSWADVRDTDITTAINTANSRNRTFTQASEPGSTGLVTGDLWFDSDDSFKQYRWDGSSWVSVRDSKIASSLQAGGSAVLNTSNQLTTINSTGIIIENSTFKINDKDTATTAGASKLVINSSGITARDSAGNNKFVIDSSGNATFAGTITGSSGVFGPVTINSNGITSTNFTISSTGSVTMKGGVTAESGKIAGFTISAASDLIADTNVGPRIRYNQGANTIMNLGWESGSYTTGTYSFTAGTNVDSLSQQFYINMKTNVFRFAADSSARTYAGEVRNALRAAPLRSIGAVVTETSSRRFKNNIVSAPKTYYDRILQVDPKFFIYNDHEEVLPELRGHHRFGMIAEDLEEAGLGYFVERDIYGRPTNLTDMMSFPLLLIPIIKEIKEELNLLNNRITQLESQL